MSRLLLLPVAVLLAAGAVVLGPGESVPVDQAATTTSVSSSSVSSAAFDLPRAGR